VIHKETVHVIPVGFDVDGIIEGLKQRPPRQVVLFHQCLEESREEKISRRNVALVKKMLEAIATVETREIGSDDVHVIFGIIMELISAYPKERYDIYANVSSGTPILNSVLLLCAMANGCRPYIVKPERILIPPYKTQLTKGAKEAYFLPLTPLQMPTEKEMDVLNVLGGMGGETDSQMDLLAELEEAGFFKREKYFSRRRRKILANRKTQLSRMLGQMEEKGLVETERAGRRTVISVTPTGRFLSLK